MSRVAASQSSPVVPGVDGVVEQAGSENFPVASRLLPAGARRHLLAIYGFARLTDDIGDEVPGDRLAMLDWLEGELEAAAAGAATHPLLVRLGRTIIELELPLAPFRALIEANRQDQLVQRYPTFDDLVAYCMLSAAPVGQLVLMVFGVATPERIARANDVCIGLQLVEHLQDVAEDAARGRVYMPLDDLRRSGCDVAALGAPSASASVRRLVAREVGRTRPLLQAGVALAASLALRQRLAVAGFVAGGLASLDAIEAADYDVLAVTCRPRRRRFVARLATVAASSCTLDRTAPS